MHNLAWFVVCELEGGVSTGLLMGIKAVMLFFASALFFCDDAHSEQCLTPLKAIATAVVLLGTVIYYMPTSACPTGPTLLGRHAAAAVATLLGRHAAAAVVPTTDVEDKPDECPSSPAVGSHAAPSVSPPEGRLSPPATRRDSKKWSLGRASTASYGRL